MTYICLTLSDIDDGTVGPAKDTIKEEDSSEGVLIDQLQFSNINIC